MPKVKKNKVKKPKVVKIPSVRGYLGLNPYIASMLRNK
jgi:hypothetical protein